MFLKVQLLDFRGKFYSHDDVKFDLAINKPINMISSTKDAFIDLNTTAGSLLGENPGSCFTINNGGSGSNVSGIIFHNTQVWIYDAHNVVLNNISVIVENKKELVLVLELLLYVTDLLM